MHRFQDLVIWKKSMDLAELVYKLTSNFPKEERYGLTSQLRRCAVSIPSNIAEGAGRNNKREFNQFLGIALGSLAELETQSNLALRFSFFKEEDYSIIEQIIIEVRKMIYSLQQKLK